MREVLRLEARYGQERKSAPPSGTQAEAGGCLGDGVLNMDI